MTPLLMAAATSGPRTLHGIRPSLRLIEPQKIAHSLWDPLSGTDATFAQAEALLAGSDKLVPRPFKRYPAMEP